MKLEFCAVCGTTEGLHQHHIDPVIRTGITRKKSKGYDDNKKLKDCDSFEVFAWLFDQGIITDDGQITVCDYHHNILHGIVKYQLAQHNDLIKLGIQKARDNGVILGRPTKLNQEMFNDIKRSRDSGEPIKKIASRLKIGVGTVYRVIDGDYIPSVSNKIKELTFVDLYD